MSTFLSWPSLSLFTLTLQPGSTSRAANGTAKTRNELMSRNLSMRMLRSFLCGSRGPLDSGTSLSNVGNADRQMAANGNFTKERFNRTGFRDAGVGKRAQIGLYCRKILRHVGIPYS